MILDGALDSLDSQKKLMFYKKNNDMYNFSFIS